MNKDIQLSDKAWRLLGDIELLVKLDHHNVISVSAYRRETAMRGDLYDVRNHIIEVKWNMFSDYEPLRDVDVVEDLRDTLSKKEKELYSLIPRIKEALDRTRGILYKRLEEASKLAFDHKSTREWVEKYGRQG